MKRTPTLEMQALCSLTPGGSEFAKDIDACVKYVKDKSFNSHKAIVSLAKERNKLRNSHDALVEALEKCIKDLKQFGGIVPIYAMNVLAEAKEMK